jgi:hypothetical protein
VNSFEITRLSIVETLNGTIEYSNSSEDEANSLFEFWKERFIRIYSHNKSLNYIFIGENTDTFTALNYPKYTYSATILKRDSNEGGSCTEVDVIWFSDDIDNIKTDILSWCEGNFDKYSREWISD